MTYKIWLALFFITGSSHAFGARQLHADTIKKTDGSVLTVPSATDTLVGKATTDTLTNKSISGSTNTITNVSLTTGVTGTLPVANGGTGLATLTSNNVILGNGTSNPTFVAPGASGNVLTSDGTTWTSAAGTAAPRSEVKLISGNGTGSTNTAIRRFNTVSVNNGGSDMTITQSATLGDSITVNTTGIYFIQLTDANSSDMNFGATRNTATPTASFGSAAQTERLASDRTHTTDFITASGTYFLTAGDVIRHHIIVGGGPTNGNSFVHFWMLKVNN